MTDTTISVAERRTTQTRGNAQTVPSELKKIPVRTLPPGKLSELTDQQLAGLLEEELKRYTPRGKRFALLMGGGATPEVAARAARLSDRPKAIEKAKSRVQGALRIIQEQARRESRLNLNSAVDRFDGLSKKAEEDKDYGASARALSEACKLLGLYPDAKSTVTHKLDMSDVSPEEWEALALLRHGVRRGALPGEIVDAEIVTHPALPERTES